jgi:hypothetical protein
MRGDNSRHDLLRERSEIGFCSWTSCYNCFQVLSS